MQETHEMWVRSLGEEDMLESEVAHCSSILAWRILRAEEPDGLQSTGLQRVRHNWAGMHYNIPGLYLPLLISFLESGKIQGHHIVPKEQSVSPLVVSNSLQPLDYSYQAPISMEFFRQEYWSGLPCPSPGDLSNPGTEPGSPALQADSLLSEPPGKLPKRTEIYFFPKEVERINPCSWVSISGNQL